MVTLNWGILGAGNISGQFVHDLLLNNTKETGFKHVIKSIGCSSTAKGEEFLAKNNFKESNNEGVTPKVQGYQDFYSNKDIDIVYVGTPHVFHKEQVIECLNHDKHVLCEKPFTINEKDSKELFDLAAKKNKFLMEAVWTRFLPIIDQLKLKIFQDKVIGDVFRVFADFSYDADLDNCPEDSRVRNSKLGGGALLDIGIYSITYGRILLDEKLGADHAPFDLTSAVVVDSTDNVDYNTSILMKYNTGKIGILTCSNYAETLKPFARVDGTKGYIELYAENPARLRSFKVFLKSGETYEIKDDEPYNGFIHEANAVAQDIADGKTLNAVVPPEETLLMMNIMDRVRAAHDFKYPME